MTQSYLRGRLARDTCAGEREGREEGHQEVSLV